MAAIFVTPKPPFVDAPALVADMRHSPTASKHIDVPAIEQDSTLAELQERVAEIKTITAQLAGKVAALVAAGCDRVPTSAMVRAAAELPEQELLRVWKPEYEKHFSKWKTFGGVRELCTELRARHDEDLAERIMAAAKEKGLAAEALDAIEELRFEASTPIPGCYKRYETAAEIKADLASAFPKEYINEVDLWFDAYASARDTKA